MDNTPAGYHHHKLELITYWKNNLRVISDRKIRDRLTNIQALMDYSCYQLVYDRRLSGLYAINSFLRKFCETFIIRFPN